MRIRLDHTRLAALLSAKAMSQNNWAMKLGLSSGHLADLVNGKHAYPSAVTRDKLLAGLGASFDELFTIEMRGARREESGDFQSRFQAALAGRYIVDGVVGQGGMGTVYLARDVKHGRQVAIKVVLPDAISVMGNAQFLREIRRTARLQHPNILPLLDSGEAAECPYLVAPYVKRGSLRHLLDERGRLTPTETLELMRGICAALAYAHEERLVHCDIKPDNVLYSGGQAVIADFGISRAVHLDGRMREPGIDTSSGTPAYVSPEQATGDVIDPRSDQYSAACLAFELMAGHPPFGGDNAMAIVSRRFLAEAPDLRAVVRMCRTPSPVPFAGACRSNPSDDTRRLPTSSGRSSTRSSHHRRPCGTAWRRWHDRQSAARPTQSAPGSAATLTGGVHPSTNRR